MVDSQRRGRHLVKDAMVERVSKERDSDPYGSDLKRVGGLDGQCLWGAVQSCRRIAAAPISGPKFLRTGQPLCPLIVPPSGTDGPGAIKTSHQSGFPVSGRSVFARHMHFQKMRCAGNAGVVIANCLLGAKRDRRNRCIEDLRQVRPQIVLNSF